MEKDPFEEYLRSKEPNKRQRGYAWQTAIGLQKVDGLETSDYLKETAYRNIEGEITIDEAKSLIESYYEQPRKRHSQEHRTEEADKVASRIADILSGTGFSFSEPEYLSIHRKLFLGIFPHAGKIRDYNLTKKEWILDEDTMIYGETTELKATLEYDLQQERDFSYNGLSMSEIIAHLARFVSRLWQIHVFAEGNTRTTAVFFIKYLRTLGFDVTNDVFAENAWYFRNAMVRANYNNLEKGVHETTEYLELFLRNLLLGEHNVLKSRYTHIRWSDEIQGLVEKKQDINNEKQDIGNKKQDIQDKFPYYKELADHSIKGKTFSNIKTLYWNFGLEKIFGRTEVMEALGITASPSSELISRMKNSGIIEPVKGMGKGKYRFRP